MVDAIVSDDVIKSWKTTHAIPSRSRERNHKLANTIYNLVNRGQSRSFRNNAILRIGKYLFASRISNRVRELREMRPPSKGHVATAGSTGEGNAVTRALNDFVQEVHHGATTETIKEEICKCKQWWNDEKIWNFLADAIGPAILLLIPSGHKVADEHRLWDSE